MKQYLKPILENFEFVFFNEEDPEEFENLQVDQDEAANAAHSIANNSGLNILSDKNLSGVLIDTDDKQIVGGLWVSNNDRDFSFDIAIIKEYRNKGLSYKLIDNAMEEYNYQNDMHNEIYDKPLPMSVDVINPILANTLKNKYGFKVIQNVSSDRVLMSL